MASLKSYAEEHISPSSLYFSRTFVPKVEDYTLASKYIEHILQNYNLVNKHQELYQKCENKIFLEVSMLPKNLENVEASLDMTNFII